MAAPSKSRKPTKRPARPLRLAETYSGRFSSPLKVDRDKGVIYGVKVLGWKSANNREYTRECAEKAIKARLYEGCKVRINHRARPGEQRDLRDSFGKLAGARCESDGIYADLHYLTTHELAESVCEDAEKGLGVYGLSHDAEAADYEIKEGVQVITELAAVSSVDIVDDAATNSSLSEGRKIANKIKVSALLEQLAADKRLTRAQRRKLLEMDGYDGPAEMDEPAPSVADADPMQMLAQAAAALAASGDPAQHEMGMKIMKLLKPEDAAVEQDDEKKDGDEVTEEDETDDDKKESKKGKKPAPARATLTEAQAKSLAKGYGIASPTPQLLATLQRNDLDGATAILETVQAHNGRAAGNGGDRGGPRSSSGVGVTEGRETYRAPQTVKEFAASIRE